MEVEEMEVQRTSGCSDPATTATQRRQRPSGGSEPATQRRQRTNKPVTVEG